MTKLCTPREVADEVNGVVAVAAAAAAAAT